MPTLKSINNSIRRNLTKYVEGEINLDEYSKIDEELENKRQEILKKINEQRKPRKYIPKDLRKQIWKKYDYTCQGCGHKTMTDWGLDIHHIDENPMNNDVDNLELRCPSCHRGWYL